jgi:hypothetical protein
MTGIGLRSLAVAVVACWGAAAWGQAPANDGAWANKDAEGRAAPMTFGVFHANQLTYGQVVEKLTDAGCKREEAETFVRFECETNPKQWYLTKPGRPEHAGLSVVATGPDGTGTVNHSRMLSEKLELNPQPSSIERREAYAVWTEKLPNRYRPPAGSSGRVDWEAILKDAPLKNTEIRTPLTYDVMLGRLNAAADCKREDLEGYTWFDCTASKTRWYLTREGMPAHGAMVLMFSRAYLGGDEASYQLGMSRSFPAVAGGKALTPEERDAATKVRDEWIRALPGQKSWAAPPPPLGFSLASTPFVEDDFQSRPLPYDAFLQKLTGAGCNRKDVGEYISFSCKGNPMLFVLSAPSSKAHPAMAVVEVAPDGKTVFPRSTRTFFNPLQPRAWTEEEDRAFSKWGRGLGYLTVSQLR